jgi:hypothetical protein
MPGRAHLEGGQEVIVCKAENAGVREDRTAAFWQRSEDSNLSVLRGLKVVFEISIFENV